MLGLDAEAPQATAALVSAACPTKQLPAAVWQPEALGTQTAGLAACGGGWRPLVSAWPLALLGPCCSPWEGGGDPADRRNYFVNGDK